jgi:excisionase family DNA binding protein
MNQDPFEELTSKFIAVAEASEISGFTTGYIRKLLRRGRIEGLRIGRDWVTTEEAIREYLRTKRGPGRPRKK